MKGISGYLMAFGFLAALLSGFLLWGTDSEAEVIEACLTKGGSERQICFAEVIEEQSSKGKITEAFELLAASYRADSEFAANCHGNVHEIGKDAYHFFKTVGSVEQTPLSSYCGYGYYHGFMEQLIQETGDFEEARAFCKSASTSPYEISAFESACYHGIGHGTVDGSDPRLWGDDQQLIKEGLATCARLSSVEHERHLCATGVFNSLAIMYPDPKYHLTYDRSDPYAICRAQRQGYERNACYEQLNTLVDSLAGRDVAKALEYTKSIQSEQGRAQAIEGLMFTVATHKPPHQFQEIAAICQKLPTTLAEWCVRGYGVGLAEFGAPGEEHEQSLAFCRFEGLEVNERAACFHRSLNYLKNFYSAGEFRAICKEEVPMEQRHLCDS